MRTPLLARFWLSSVTLPLLQLRPLRLPQLHRPLLLLLRLRPQLPLHLPLRQLLRVKHT